MLGDFCHAKKGIPIRGVAMKIVAVLYPGASDAKELLSCWDVREMLSGCVRWSRLWATNWSP